MRTTKYIILLFTVLSTCFVSAQDLFTTIDVLRPGRVQFPETVNNVLIVNNAVQQPHDYAHQSRLMGQMTSNAIIDTDSALIYFLTTFTQSLDQQHYFNSVDLLEKSQNTSGRYFEQHPLGSLQIDHLRKMYDADAVIVLNRLILSDLIEDFVTAEDDFCAVLEARCVSVWQIFMPNQERPLPLTLSDTLVWSNTDYRRSDALEALPDRRDALLDMAIISAQTTAEQLVPHWEQRDRYFYEHSDRVMKEALDLFYHKQWDEAIGKWYEAYQRGNNKLKARAAANMAGAFEIEGDLNSAYYWAKMAAEHFGSGFFSTDRQQQQNLEAYADELKIRLIEAESL